MLSCLAIVVLLFIGRDEYKQSQMESKLPDGKEKQRIDFGENIRVLIKTDGFRQITHTEVRVSSEAGLRVTTADEVKEYGEGEIVEISPDDPYLKQGTVKLKPMQNDGKILLHSVTRGMGTPSYRGTLELFGTAEGIAIVNELRVEEYLYGVVPSEMPASYEMEALKAQAICARTYAYRKMQEVAYPEYRADVDDSVSFQVYRNSEEQERTNQAVNDTGGQLLVFGKQLAATYFYSTSCGKTAGIEAWGTKGEEYPYLSGVEVCNEDGEDFEKSLPWYRWEIQIPESKLLQMLELNVKKELGELKTVEVTEKGAGGVALKLKIEGTMDTVVVETEYQIRKVLGGNQYTLTKNDGSQVAGSELLPSAFFEIQKQGDAYLIRGGGYGHGIGMSQNGANEMAKNGKNVTEILQKFYPGTEVVESQTLRE